jgi:hypothetical protein
MPRGEREEVKNGRLGVDESAFLFSVHVEVLALPGVYGSNSGIYEWLSLSIFTIRQHI